MAIKPTVVPTPSTNDVFQIFLQSSGTSGTPTTTSTDFSGIGDVGGSGAKAGSGYDPSLIDMSSLDGKAKKKAEPEKKKGARISVAVSSGTGMGAMGGMSGVGMYPPASSQMMYPPGHPTMPPMHPSGYPPTQQYGVPPGWH